jgi:hypothetical protein
LYNYGSDAERTTVVTTAADVAKRKRPEGERPGRLVVEYYTAEELALVRRVRIAAVLAGVSVREWVLQALRDQLERTPPGDEDAAPRAE